MLLSMTSKMIEVTISNIQGTTITTTIQRCIAQGEHTEKKRIHTNMCQLRLSLAAVYTCWCLIFGFISAS